MGSAQCRCASGSIQDWEESKLLRFSQQCKKDKSTSSKKTTADGQQPTSVEAGASPAGNTEVISIGRGLRIEEVNYCTPIAMSAALATAQSATRSLDLCAFTLDHPGFLEVIENAPKVLRPHFLFDMCQAKK